MKKYLYLLVALCCFFLTDNMRGQVADTPIKLRWDNNGQAIKGDFMLIGNLRKVGGNLINISDPSHGNRPTMNASAATLRISSPSSCLRVKWAGLYWAAPVQMGNNDVRKRQVKFKLPGQNYYHSLTADVHMQSNFANIEDAYNSFKDVTSLLQSIGSNFNNGEYVVGDIYSDEFDQGWGGWNLVVVYEDVNANTSKRIYIYDGSRWNFFQYAGKQTRTIPITGFQTPPAPAPIKARIGLFTGAGNMDSFDQLKINGHVQGNGTSVPNRNDDFMDASVSLNHSLTAMPRNPITPLRTTFVDIDVFDISNPNNTVIANGATSLNIEFVAEDAYITFVVPFSVDAIAPHVETQKEVLGLEAGQWKDFTNKQVAFGDALKYRLKFRNIGNDNVRDAILEDLLPKGITYENFEQPLPSGVTFISATPNYNNTGRTMIKFQVDPSLLQYSPTAPFSAPIVLNVKVNPDCADLIDFCSNEMKNQAEMLYHASLDNKEYRTGSFANTGGACDQNSEEATTFFVKDDSCASQRLPFCGGMVLKGGSGFVSWKWTKEGQAGVIATTEDLPISSAGVYWVERTPPPGGNRCNNTLRIKYDVYNRTGDELHPLRNAPYITEREVCNIDGKEYLGIAVCNGQQILTITDASLTDGQVTWYKYKIQRPKPTDGCPPVVLGGSIQSDSQWQLVHTGKSFTLKAVDIHANGSEYAVRIGHPNCPLTYHFRAYKGDLTYSATVENIICGIGKIKVAGLPNGTYQWKLSGPAGSTSYTDLAAGTTHFDIPVTQAGAYQVYIRAKVANFQENVCEYIKDVDVASVTDDTAFTVTQVEEVKCVSSNPASGKLRVVVNSDVTLPVKVTVTQGTTIVTSYVVDNTTKLNSDNIPTVRNVLYALPAANNYKVVVEPTYRTGCSVTHNNITIDQVPELKINAGGAKSIACGLEKEITIKVQGGKLNPINGRYSFIVKNQAGTITYDDVEVFEGAGGTPVVHIYTLKVKDTWVGPGSKVYKVFVYDENNCETSKEITYEYQEKPIFTLDKVVDAVCSATSGQLKVSITNTNFHASDYTQVQYVIRKQNADGTWPDWDSQIRQSNNTFRDLAVGKYQARIYYTKGTITCHYPEDCITYTVHGGGTHTECNPPHTDPIEQTISEGNGPIRAFAGVIQLACETPANSASIRVANVKGGTTNSYQYSIDNGVTWQLSNTFDNLTPGLYHVKVQNVPATPGGPVCEWNKDIQVMAPIARPTLNASIKYDCDGIARANITTDKGTYSYSLSHTPGTLPTVPPSGFTAGTVPPATFPNITSSGNQTIRVFYKETASPNPIVLLQEDFGQGVNRCDPNVYSAYGCVLNSVIHDGYYVVTSAENNQNTLANGCWTTPRDHTGLPNGRYLAMNVGSIGYNKPIYTKEVEDVVPTQPIKFKMYVYNLCFCTSCGAPLFQIRVVDKVTGANLVPPSSTLAPPLNGHDPNAWYEFSGELASPGVTSLRIEIVSMSPVISGNDLALDDIYVYQEPKACASSYVDLTVHVEKTESKKFKISSHQEVAQSCYGVNDGKMRAIVENYGTGSYKWKVTTSAGVNVQPSTGWNSHNNGTLEVNNLAPGTYKLVLQSTHQNKYNGNTPCEVSVDFTIGHREELKVTANKTEIYLNCGVNQLDTKFYDRAMPSNGVYKIEGGVQPYKITVHKQGSPGSPEVIPSNTFQYILTEGKWDVEITDANNCSPKNFVLEVKKRNTFATISVAMSDCRTSNTKMRVTTTYNGGGNGGVPLKYEYMNISGGTPASWTVNPAGTNNPEFDMASWSTGRYRIRVSDQYACSIEKDIEKSPEINPLNAGDYIVTHNSVCGSVQQGGSITVTHVTGGSASPLYHYAFVEAGQTPNDSDYTASASKTFPYTTQDKHYDIYIKDVNTIPVACGKKVVGNVEIKGAVPTEIDPSTSNIIVHSATCTGESGKLVIRQIKGRGPYRVELQQTAPTSQTFPVVRIPAQPIVSNYEIPGLAIGSYSLKITDEGNGNCNPFTGGAYTFTISDMHITVNPVQFSTPSCTANDMGFTLSGSSDIQPASDYEMVYRITKENGNPYTGSGSSWQTSGTFTGYNIGNRYVTEVGVRLKVAPQTVVCIKEVPEFTLQANHNITFTPSATGNCSTFNLKVTFAHGSYDSVVFYLNHDGAPAEATSGELATPLPYTGTPTYTFNNLQLGRTYVVYVHYKVAGSSQTCRANKEVEYTGTAPLDPRITFDGASSGVACTPGASVTVNLNFKIQGGVAPFTYQVYEVTSTGALQAIAGASGTAVMGNNQISISGQNIPAGQSKQYAIGITDGNSPPCTTYTRNITVRATDNPMNLVGGGTNLTFTNTKAIGCDGTSGGFTLTASSGFTGGTPPFTYKVLRANNGSIGLRRDIVVSGVGAGNNPTFNFRPTDFTTLPFPAGSTLTITVIDATGCEVTLSSPVSNIGKFANSQHKAKFTISINNATACTGDTYDMILTLSDLNAPGVPSTPVPPYNDHTSYEYSIDNGIHWTTFTANPQTIAIPALFDHNKVKVRHKESKCEATKTILPPVPSPGQVYTYPKLKFTTAKESDVICIPGPPNKTVAKIKVTILSGSDFVPPGVTLPTYPGTDHYTIQVKDAGGTVISGVTVTWPTPHRVAIVEVPVTGGTPPTITNFKVEVKDNGNAYCNTFQTAGGTVGPFKNTEDDNALKARHSLSHEDASGCQPGSETGKLVLTRNKTANAREEGSYTYELTRSATAGGSYSLVRNITDADITQEDATKVVYTIPGLRKGYYKITIKQSPNGTCPVEITSGAAEEIKEQTSITEDATQGNAKLYQMGCDALASADAAKITARIPGFTNATPREKAYLYIPVKGGVPPYTFEVIEAGRVIATKQGTVTTPPTPPAVASDYQVFELEDRGANYTVAWKVTDARGCSIENAPGVSFMVRTLAKTQQVTVRRTQQMACNPAINEELELTIRRNIAGTNTNGYDAYIERIPAPPATAVVVQNYDGTREPAGATPGTIKLTLPNNLPAGEDTAEYRITLKDLDTNCTYTLSELYRVTRTPKPTVNVSVTQGACNDGSATPAPTLRFRVEVSGGAYEQGYSYKITEVGGGGFTAGPFTDSAAVSEKEVTVSGGWTANTARTFKVELQVTHTQCSASAQTQVSIPNTVTATSALLSPMTYCGTQAQNDAVIGLTSGITGGWGAPYQIRLVSVVSGGTQSTPWGTATVFRNIGEGTHHIEIKDVKGCEYKLSPFTIPQWSASMALTKGTATVTNPTCSGDTNGKIVLSGVTGGSVVAPATPVPPTYSYTLYDKATDRALGRVQGDDAGHTGQVTFTGIGAGTYYIKIGAALLCHDDWIKSDDIVVKDPGTIIARASLSTYPGCATAGDIRVVVEARPNMDPTRSPYTFTLYEVTSGSRVAVPGATASTSGTIPGEVTATFTGVIPRPTAEKKYEVEVKDNNGAADACIGTSNVVTVDKVEDITATIDMDNTTAHLNCFGSTYGKITVRARGGKNDEGYRFAISPVPSGVTSPNTTGVFEGLPAGTYTITVDQVNGGCPAVTKTQVITEEPKYRAQYEVKNVECNGMNNGSFKVKNINPTTKLDGSVRKFTYAITPHLDRFLDNDGKFEGLAPGKYYVIMQDENGCRPEILDEGGTPTGSDIFEFTITEPEILSVTVNDDATVHESCFGANDGKTKLRIYGGTAFTVPPALSKYKYSKDGGATWEDYNETQGIENLAAGDYTFMVKDANGCQATAAQMTIKSGSKVSLHLNEIGYRCVDGVLKYIVEASVTPATEALNVRYQLNGVAHNNARFELEVDLTGGTTRTYVISAIHSVAGHGDCKKDQTVTVGPQTALSITLVNRKAVKCNGGKDGSFTIAGAGGSGHYQYGIKQADGTYNWQDSGTFNNLEVGSYTAAVKDKDFDCIVEKSNIQIEEPNKIVITQVRVKHVGCKGASDGRIEFNFSEGTPVYSWEAFKADGTTTGQRGSNLYSTDTAVVQNLSAGKYLIVVKDSNGCEQTKNFEIIEGVDLKGEIVQNYHCNSSIGANNVVLRVGASDTAAAATYDVYVSVTTPYLVLSPGSHSAANRLRYGFTGNSTTDRYEFSGTTPIGDDNTHNMYQIRGADLTTQLASVTPIREDAAQGTKTYKMYLYYYDKDNPAIGDPALCYEEREFTIEYHDPLKITNQSIANDLNLVKVKVEGGKQKYTVYFGSAEYNTVEEIKARHVQRETDVVSGKELTYYVQKTDYEELNPATGKIEKKIRVYVEDEKGCAHSVFIYKEFEDVVIPNYFTPNGDGQYDTWAPLNLASYPQAETKIYDRYGRHIATLNNHQEWDGTYGGKELPAGDYWYILQLNEPDDNRTFKGHFTLYR